MKRLDGKFPIEWIPVKNICVIWAGAQRPYNAAWARKIADKFDPEQFDPIRVTLPNGNGIYHAVEGQHRRSAVAMRFGEDEKAPCIVLQASTPEHAAKLWLESNRNKKMAQPIDAFLVAVVAEEKIEVEINRLVNACGYYIGHVSLNSKKNTIQAVQALRTVYNRYGAVALTTAINQISATWGKDPNSVVGPIISGYGAFFGEFPASKVNLGRLVQVIQNRFTPGRFLGAARSKRDATGKQMPACVKDVLVERYNYGLKNGKLQPK